MGGPKRIKRVRLSRNTWMNSLISICFSRPNIGGHLLYFRLWLFQPLVEGAGCGDRQYEGKHRQRYEIGIEHGRRRAFEEYFLEHRDVIAGRKNSRDPLQDDGHLLDGKQESRQEKCGKECDEQRDLAGSKLILGKDGNEEAKREHNDHEQGRADGEGNVGTAKRNVEPADGNDRADGNIEHAEDEIGSEFARHDFHGGDGRGNQLLHRATLPLSRDGERGEESADDRHDKSKHAGNDEGTAFEIFVVPDRKSTRLNSSHLGISYAVFCL